MKKLLIFLLLFAFGFGAYCDDYLLFTASISRPTGGVTEFITFGTIPIDGNYRIEFNYTSAYCSLGSHVTISHAFGTYNNSVYDRVGTGPLFCENSCPFISSKTGDFLAGDTLVIQNYVSSSYATSFSVIIKVYSPVPVGSVPVITSSLAVTGVEGEPFSYTITGTENPDVFFATNWPSFLSRNGAVVSGTIPVGQSNFTFDIACANDFGTSLDKTVNVTVSPPVGEAPEITSSLSVNADAGQSFSYTITATGDPTITYGASNLPSFLSFSGSTVSGTVPTGQTVDFSFDISATNNFGSDSETVNVHAIAGQAPVITSPVTVPATSGTAFSYSVTATGSPTITYSASSLPSFLSFSGSIVSGTLPVSLVAVSYSFTVGASNSFGSDSKTVTINATAGSGTGQFDSDDDVPAINAMKEAVVASLESNSDLIINNLADLHYAIIDNGAVLLSIDNKLNLMPDIESSLAEIENFTYQTADDVGNISDDTLIIRDDVGLIKTDLGAFKTLFDDYYTDFDLWSTTFDFKFSQMASDIYDLTDITVQSIGPLLIEIADNTDTIKTDVGVVKADIGIVKTNVIEINNKLTNIVDVINLLDTNQDEKLESIKGVLNQQLAVQQDQLTTQESILALLEQIANPEPVPNPELPDNPDDPVTPDYAINFSFDKESNSGDLQKYEKTFPVFDTALRQRQGTVDYTFKVPLHSVTPLLEDRYVNFSSGVIGDFVSGIRAILCCVLFYFTLKYWFCAVRRITD